MIIEISRTLESDIMNFVKVNEVDDINGFLANCLRDGFNIAKYGVSPKDNFKNENKPLKIENYENTEESNSKGVEKEEGKRKGSTKKRSSTSEESIKPIEKTEESIKPKKTIRIIKK